MEDEKIRGYNLASKIQSLYIFSEIKGNYSKVLDLGAGDGEITFKLLKMTDYLCSVDNDPIKINRIIRGLNQFSNKKVFVNCCSARKLPYEDSFFDLIICNSVLEHINDYRLVLNEIYRVLKPNGELIITVPNSDFQFGHRFRIFWLLILKLPKVIRFSVCRKRNLGTLDDISSIRRYFKDYFNHKIDFNENRIKKELSFGLELTHVRYFMNYFGAFFHDLAYYFRFFDNNILLKICFLGGYFEYLFISNAKGKGFLGRFRCIK